MLIVICQTRDQSAHAFLSNHTSLGSKVRLAEDVHCIFVVCDTSHIKHEHPVIISVADKEQIASCIVSKAAVVAAIQCVSRGCRESSGGKVRLAEDGVWYFVEEYVICVEIISQDAVAPTVGYKQSVMSRIDYRIRRPAQAVGTGRIQVVRIIARLADEV